MKCEDCYHCDICHLRIALNMDYDEVQDKTITNAEKCDHFKDKSQIIELPMMTTDWLKEELTQYCFERCVDEL